MYAAKAYTYPSWKNRDAANSLCRIPPKTELFILKYQDGMNNRLDMLLFIVMSMLFALTVSFIIFADFDSRKSPTNLSTRSFITWPAHKGGTK